MDTMNPHFGGRHATFPPGLNGATPREGLAEHAGFRDGGSDGEK